MAIYKLKDLYSKKPEYGIGLKAESFGKYKYVRQGDINKKIFSTFVNKGPLLLNGDILISRAGANSGESYIHELKGEYVFAGFLVRYSFNEQLINKYFYLWTKSRKYKKQVLLFANSGSTMPKLNPPVFGSIKINLPNLKEQQKIIDIIEPLEILGSNIKNQLEKISLFIMKLPIKKTIVKNIFSEIKTGKLNANAATKEGFYPFFTCSSKIQKTNFNSFKGRYIILSGNGEIYTWWMDGEFDLYQRVYALKEKENFFSTYFSVKKGIENLRRRSNGAVIKFIKKSDIESIEKYESNYEQILKYLFIVENKLQKKLSKLNKIKGHLIKLLIK